MPPPHKPTLDGMRPLLHGASESPLKRRLKRRREKRRLVCLLPQGRCLRGCRGPSPPSRHSSFVVTGPRRIQSNSAPAAASRAAADISPPQYRASTREYLSQGSDPLLPQPVSSPSSSWASW